MQPPETSPSTGRRAIALVHPFSWPTVRRGGERYLHDLAWYLARAGEHVTIVTGRGSPERDRVDGAEVHRIWRQPPGWSRRSPRLTTGWRAATLRPVLRRQRPDIVHALMPGAALGAVRAGITTVYTSLGAPDRAWARQWPRRWRPIEAAARRADVVTAVGEEAAAQLADLVGRPVVALQPGLRSERFRPHLEPRTGAPTVLFASAVNVANKGFVTLLRAMEHVRGEHPDARLQVIGPGSLDGPILRAGLRQQPDWIEHAAPPVGELDRWYGRATVTALVSRAEAFGLVLAESLACGTPVVASDRGGPREVLADADGLVGTLATFDDVASVADALLRAIVLARDPATPARCVDHAARWDWDQRIGPRHAELYDTL